MYARVLVLSGFLRYCFGAEMREELPIVDGLKRAAIALGALLVISSGAALAQTQLSTQPRPAVVTLGVYDNRCEKLAPRLLVDLQRMIRMLDKAAVMAGVISEQDTVDEAGEAKWCDTFRPVVEKFKDGLFDPDEATLIAPRSNGPPAE